jgi:hypothetical protein
MTDYLKLVGGRPTNTVAVVSSAGVADAGKIAKLDSSGRLDASTMPVGIAADTKSFTASENIAARDLINVAGTGQIRKADASNDRPAVGFALAAIASAAAGNVYFEGVIPGFSGLTVGAPYFLSDSAAGGVTATAVTAGAGKISQQIGVAISATEISFEPQTSYPLG